MLDLFTGFINDFTKPETHLLETSAQPCEIAIR